MNDEFYIGWQDRAPVDVGRRMRRIVLFLGCAALALGVLLAAAQRNIGIAVFEWGTVKTFSGVFRSHPVPHLLVPQHDGGDTARFDSHLLVAPFKFGLERALTRTMDGAPVTLEGTLIHRDSERMIEVRPGSIRRTSMAAPDCSRLLRPVSLGRHTLLGEIVDSKCYFGVMNPGRLKPHRACAIRCISGGIPPVLLVRRADAKPLYFILISPENAPVNSEVLPFVAEPVSITGEVLRQGDLLILRADPACLRRLP